MVVKTRKIQYYGLCIKKTKLICSIKLLVSCWVLPDKLQPAKLQGSKRGTKGHQAGAVNLMPTPGPGS